MNKTRTLHAVTLDDHPVLMTEYTLDPVEQEVVEVRDLIIDEMATDVPQAGALAVAALPKPDAEFVEYLTRGALTLDASGALTGDPATLLWLDGVRRGKSVW